MSFRVSVYFKFEVERDLSCDGVWSFVSVEECVPELSTGHFSWTRPDPAKR